MSGAWVWRFQARLVRVIDGDTAVLTVDTGFNTYAVHTVRLAGVNTPELHAKDLVTRAKALEAKEFTLRTLQQWSVTATPNDWPLHIETSKSDVFGRWVAKITPSTGTLPERDLSAALIAAGLGVPFMITDPTS